jgi:hypothetical protein
MSEIGIGLPNQALKSIVSTFSNSVIQTSPFERTFTTAVLVAATETDVFPVTAIGSNLKVTMDSLIVSGGNADTIFKLYRNGVLITVYEQAVAAASEQAFQMGIGKEYDEAQTYRLTATSAAGGSTATASVSGRSELKRNELFSQVIG